MPTELESLDLARAELNCRVAALKAAATVYADALASVIGLDLAIREATGSEAGGFGEAMEFVSRYVTFAALRDRIAKEASAARRDWLA